eukprot:GEMP01010643.1.p1 GENE.GEMP01010643.1~~GEMP01010643.1.p1  ORF type:complete len:522 (+),score=91.76 GEMP01010643.1:68-1633(+)
MSCWDFLCFPNIFQKKGSNLITTAFTTKLRDIIPGDRFFHVNGEHESDQDDVTSNKSLNEAYKTDRSHFKSDVAPKVVVFPLSTEEVAAVAKLCYQYKINMIAAGQKSGLEGGVIPMHREVVIIDLMKMKKIDLNKEDMHATVESGLLKSEFAKFLEPHGLFYAPDPASDSSLGGQASTSGSGTTSVMYGTTRENILSLTVVLPDGRIIWKTRPVVRKNSTGYHLTDLFMGAEGTLGIVTRVVTRVRRNPKCVCGGSIAYEETKYAVECVIRLMANQVPVARCELLNKTGCIETNAYFNTSLSEHPHLFFEFHTNDEIEARRQFEVLQRLAHPLCETDLDRDWRGAPGYPTIMFTTDKEEMETIWRARRGAYFSCLNSRKRLWPAGKPQETIQMFATDSCLPLSKLTGVMLETEVDFDRTLKPLFGGMDLFIIAHIADGNFHCSIPIIDEERHQVEEFHDRLCYRVLAAGGTVSGEHGVGIGKRKFLRAEHGNAAVDVMWQIKKALDPLNLMNPGKVLPGE